jgi:hypothetical protein
MQIKYLIWLLAMTIPFLGFSQEGQKEHWFKKLNIQPALAVQVWGTYTTDAAIYDDQLEAYVPVDDRVNFQIRRMRFGFKANPSPNFKFVAIGAFDLIGRDVLAGTVGGSNNGGRPQFSLWNTYFQWRIKKDSEAFNLVGGYFLPQIGRESLNSAMSVNTMEKAWSQNYYRRHLAGTGPGRAAGVNLGGLLLTDDRKFGVQYNLGIFSPVFGSFGGNSVGRKASPLFVGRTVWYIGDPEQTKYQISYKNNYWSQRKGLSIGLSGAWQGATDLFLTNAAAELDFLLNWGPWNIDGSWLLLWREGQQGTNGSATTFSYQSNVGHLRGSYNILLSGGEYMLEPAIMLVQFNGATDAEAQAQAEIVGADSGLDYYWDTSVNFHLAEHNIVVSMSYTWRRGALGAAAPGSTINQFFVQNPAGAIQRGNYLGLGVLAKF